MPEGMKLIERTCTLPTGRQRLEHGKPATYLDTGKSMADEFLEPTGAAIDCLL